MMATMKTVDPIAVIRARLRDKSQKDLCRELDIPESYLSDVLRGRRDPGPLICEAFGLERVVTYRKRPVDQGVSQ